MNIKDFPTHRGSNLNDYTSMLRDAFKGADVYYIGHNLHTRSIRIESKVCTSQLRLV